MTKTTTVSKSTDITIDTTKTITNGTITRTVPGISIGRNGDVQRLNGITLPSVIANDIGIGAISIRTQY